MGPLTRELARRKMETRLHSDNLPLSKGSTLGVHPSDPFIILGAVVRGTIPLAVASNETLEGAKRTAELGIEAGRWQEVLIVERVCRVSAPVPQPRVIYDFFDKD